MGEVFLVLFALFYSVFAGMMMMLAYDTVNEKVEALWLKTAFIVVIGLFWWVFLLAGIKRAQDEDG